MGGCKTDKSNSSEMSDRDQLFLIIGKSDAAGVIRGCLREEAF